MTLNHPLTSRLLAGFGTVALLGAVGLMASRPAHSVGGPVAVSVANTPLATKPTDVAMPQQPFTAQTYYEFLDGSASGHLATESGYADIAVPAGKHLVIQTVSVSHTVINNEALQAFINPVANGKTYTYALSAMPSTVVPYSGASQTLTLYADPGTTVPFVLYRSQSSGSEYVYVTVCGYLVNA